MPFGDDGAWLSELGIIADALAAGPVCGVKTLDLSSTTVPSGQPNEDGWFDIAVPAMRSAPTTWGGDAVTPPGRQDWKDAEPEVYLRLADVLFSSRFPRLSHITLDSRIDLMADIRHTSSVDLSCFNFSERDLYVVGKLLNSNTSLSRLDLSMNSTAQVEACVSSIRTNTALQTLEVSRTVGPDSRPSSMQAKDILHFADMLTGETVTLPEELGYIATRAALQLLTSNTGLRSLALPRSMKDSTTDLRAYFLAMTSLTSLAGLTPTPIVIHPDAEHLNLDGILSLPSGAGLGFATSGLRQCSGLRSLSLAKNKVGKWIRSIDKTKAARMGAMLDALGHGATGLTSLDLSDNQLGKQGMEAILVDRPMSSALTSLDLDRNDLFGDWDDVLARRPDLVSQMVRLSLSHNNIADLFRLKETLANNHVLHTLHLSSAELRDNQGQYLIAIVQAQTALRDLRLAHNMLGNGLTELYPTLAQCVQLETLDLQGNTRYRHTPDPAKSNARKRTNSAEVAPRMWFRGVGFAVSAPAVPCPALTKACGLQGREALPAICHSLAAADQPDLPQQALVPERFAMAAQNKAERCWGFAIAVGHGRARIPRLPTDEDAR